MRIVVDPERCQGHGRCYVVAPMLFNDDDYGNATAVDGVVPEEHMDRARLAIRSCPERAIAVVAEPPPSRPEE